MPVKFPRIKLFSDDFAGAGIKHGVIRASAKDDAKLHSINSLQRKTQRAHQEKLRAAGYGGHLAENYKLNEDYKLKHEESSKTATNEKRNFSESEKKGKFVKKFSLNKKIIKSGSGIILLFGAPFVANAIIQGSINLIFGLAADILLSSIGAYLILTNLDAFENYNEDGSKSNKSQSTENLEKHLQKNKNVGQNIVGRFDSSTAAAGLSMNSSKILDRKNYYASGSLSQSIISYPPNINSNSALHEEVKILRFKSIGAISSFIPFEVYTKPTPFSGRIRSDKEQKDEKSSETAEPLNSEASLKGNDLGDNGYEEADFNVLSYTSSSVVKNTLQSAGVQNSTDYFFEEERQNYNYSENKFENKKDAEGAEGADKAENEKEKGNYALYAQDYEKEYEKEKEKVVVNPTIIEVSRDSVKNAHLIYKAIIDEIESFGLDENSKKYLYNIIIKDVAAGGKNRRSAPTPKPKSSRKPNST